MSQKETDNAKQTGLAIEVARTPGLSRVRPKDEVMAYRFPETKNLSIALLMQRALHELTHFDAHLVLAPEPNLHIKSHFLNSIPYLIEVLVYRPKAADHAFAPMTQAVLIATADAMFHVSDLLTEDDVDRWRAQSESTFPTVAFLSYEVLRANIDFVVDRALSGYEAASQDVAALSSQPATSPDLESGTNSHLDEQST